ncbi:unnamed protein product [Discosporangium mesarthrocarpum]
MIVGVDYPTPLALGSYWNMDLPCKRGHRILDLAAFMDIVDRGLITADDAISVADNNPKREDAIHLSLHTEEDVRVFFRDLKADQHRLLVLERIWGLKEQREEVSLVQPNPFHVKSARRLLSVQGWKPDKFISVQWRSERAKGDLKECYQRFVRPAIEGTRMMLSEKMPVFINTDLAVGNSDSYHHSKEQSEDTRWHVMEDLKNDYGDGGTLRSTLAQIEDSGIRAIVGGLVAANSRIMLASSLSRVTESNHGPWATLLKGYGGEEYLKWQCEKDESKYIQIIIDWRDDVMRKHPGSVVDLFPRARHTYERRFEVGNTTSSDDSSS